jgi:four helix bundle protein
MKQIKWYQDLEAWKRAMELAELCYLVTARLPRSELFGLVAQIRRASVSIAANIAEGHRRSTRGYLLHVQIALGSHAELETEIEIARRVGLMPAADCAAVSPHLAEVGRLLHGLARSLSQALARSKEPESPRDTGTKPKTTGLPIPGAESPNP